MDMRSLGRTDLQIAPLVFGGNVLGWTIDEATGFDVLDAFVDHGFNAIDTADVYSSWAPGNKGGESETILGNWMTARPGRREQLAIFTKVGSDLGEPGKKGLSERWILQAVEDSLRRLRTDRIDVYFSHWPDPQTPQQETLAAYDKLVKAGKVRSIGASNVDATQLEEALLLSGAGNLPRYEIAQPEYNLYDRKAYEGPLQNLCVKEGIGVVTYFSLASGFLSGKYRSSDDLQKSARGSGVAKYLDARGTRILAALDEVSSRVSATPAEVSLAWLMTRAGVTAPIASATRREHVESFARAGDLKLNAEDLGRLEAASA